MALTTFVASQVLTAQQLNDSFAAVGGLRAVVPTSVTVTGGGSSASVGTNGKITFSTAASLSVNGCFTSAYDNYRVVFGLDSSAGSHEFDLRLRASGTDNTSNNYAWTRAGVAGNTGASAPSSSGTSLTSYIRLSPISGTYSCGGSWDVIMPQNSSYNTVVLGQGIYVDTIASNWAGFSTQGIMSVTTSYDGFTVFCAGTFTGFMTVYGYFG